MRISFYLTRPNTKTDTAIFARICYNGYKIKYYIGEKINPKFWNKKKQRAKQTNKFRMYLEFNQRLNEWEANTEIIFHKLISDNLGKLPTPEMLMSSIIFNNLKNPIREREK